MRVPVAAGLPVSGFMSHSHRSPRVSVRRLRPGITLVEILVVIAIIVALAAIVSPIANSMRLRSQEARCMNNLRQLGVALHLYALDHGDRFPETYHTVSLDRAWVESLEPYLGNIEETRVCPGDPRKDERLAAGGTSYVLNSFIFVPEINEWGEVVGRRLNSPGALPDASRTMLAFICADRVGAGPGNDHTHSNLWNTWNAVCADIAPSRFGGDGEPSNAKGRSNYLYADGHVESIRAAELKRKIESGINIARPPGLK